MSKSTPKAGSYSNEQWDFHRPIITRMYLEERRTLKEVCEHLKKEFNFAPSLRMYKSRLQLWGLHKKKKYSEMLEVVRLATVQQGKIEIETPCLIRGQTVTLADAMQYFNRKGVKNPAALLEDRDCTTTTCASAVTPLYGVKESGPCGASWDDLASSMKLGGRHTSECALSQKGPSESPMWMHDLPMSTRGNARDVSWQGLALVHTILGVPKFNLLTPYLPPPLRPGSSAMELSDRQQQIVRHVEFLLRAYFRSTFSQHDMIVNDVHQKTILHDAHVAHFYSIIHEGCTLLWSGSTHAAACDVFCRAATLVERLLTAKHYGIIIHVLCFLVMHDGSTYNEAQFLFLERLDERLQGMRDSALEVVRLVVRQLTDTFIHRASLAEAALESLLSFFQDSIGHFHPESVALLQTFTLLLLKRKRYSGALVRVTQLLEVAEATQGKCGYTVCYALLWSSEACTAVGRLDSSLEALTTALERSQNLAEDEEREIVVGSLQCMADILIKLGRRKEAIDILHSARESAQSHFGEMHRLTHRATLQTQLALERDATSEFHLFPVLDDVDMALSASSHGSLSPRPRR